jgi:hypothetical protein
VVIEVMKGMAKLLTRTGNIIGLWAVVLLLVGPAPAEANLLCSARVDRTSAVVGGSISLTVTAEGDVSGSVDFQLPDMPSVVVSGTSYSRSQSIINGRSSVTIGKVFYLQLQSAGQLVIGSVKVSDGQSTCETDPIKVTVTTARASVDPSVSGNRVPKPAGVNPDPEPNPVSTGGRSGDDIFITLETDCSTAWVGQQVILTFRYYHRVNPWNQPQFTAPRTPGFWRENLGAQRDYRTTVGGRAYNVTEIRYAIFPTRAGNLAIDPAELSFPDQGLDRFFSSRRRQGPRTLRTDPLEIQVKQLPAGKPDDFSGLVASQVRLTALANRDSVPRGEAVDFKVSLVSDAFLKGFEGLKIPAPEDARIHDAGNDFRTTIEQKRLMGQVTLEKVIVPQQEGRLQLPRVAISWFDTRAGRYRTTNAPTRSVVVIPSDHPFLEQEDSGFLRSEVSRLGQDLVFIHNVPDHLNMGRHVLVQTPLWWTVLLLPVLLLGLFRLYLSRQQADPVFLRRQNALRRALLVMDEQSGLDHQPLPLDRLARSITGFVADCRNRSAASVDAAAVRDFCLGHGCPAEGSSLVEILQSCDVARYGGSGLIQEEQQLFEDVKVILHRLHQLEMKKPAKGGKVPFVAVLCMVMAAWATADAQGTTDPARLMAEANQAYTEGQLDVALDLYRQADALGVQDPDLFFNLGNTHARRGELGFAVVNYLRAKQLAPLDRDIHDNLAWVRGGITDLELTNTQLPLFIAQFVSLVFGLTLGQWAMVLLVLVWCLCMLIGYQWRRGDFPEGLRRVILLTAALVLVSATIVVWRWRIEEVRQTAVVVVEEVAVRSGPEANFGVQFMVHDGLTIRIQEERAGWVRISLGGESLGWMPISSVEKVRREH